MSDKPAMSRRSFNELAGFMAIRGISLSPLMQTALTAGKEVSLPSEEDDNGPTDPAATLTIAPQPNNVLDLISQYAHETTTLMSQSSAWLGKHSAVTASAYTFEYVQAGPVERQAEQGGAFSIDGLFSEVSSEHFNTRTADNGSAVLPFGPLKNLSHSAVGGIGGGIGISIGLGNLDGFNGLSTTLSATQGKYGLSVSWNEDYIGISLQVQQSIGPGTLSLTPTETTPNGEINRSYPARDLENLQNNLFDYSADMLH
jgi:hypothetical protein